MNTTYKDKEDITKERKKYIIATRLYWLNGMYPKLSLPVVNILLYRYLAADMIDLSNIVWSLEECKWLALQSRIPLPIDKLTNLIFERINDIKLSLEQVGKRHCSMCGKDKPINRFASCSVYCRDCRSLYDYGRVRKAKK